jgi:hypothetical protein
MKFLSKRLHALTATLICVAIQSPVYLVAQTSLDCTGIAANVTDAVIKEPGKVLMIIEDALVINESCACEIIVAAISAAKADAQLVTQIVQTAISVVPKQSSVIMDCAKLAGSGIANRGMTATASGKEAKNVSLDSPEPETELDSPEPNVPIRGLYLMQTPSGGFLPRTCDKDCISPTQANPNYP